MPAIEVNHVTKEFRLGQLTSLKQSALNTLSRLRGKPVPKPQPFKALDNVSFTVEEGEVLGIIGHNGAGKSTLLKILSNVTRPTRGSVSVRGKVAPLIEVGAGLIGDLTGRENIFLNGAILGIPKPEIKKKLDEIIHFAEIEEFVDTPIKRYSSGMKVRLGFAIATSIDADILIVDEVLAVGDLAFQRKCFDRMEQVIKGKGKTVLLVSHNIRQVERLCSRVLLLDHGRIKADGAAVGVCNTFYQISNDKILSTALENASDRIRVRSSGEADVVSIELFTSGEQLVEEIAPGDALGIRVRVKFNKPVEKPEFVIGTHTTDFVYLTANSSATLQDRPDYLPGEYWVECFTPEYPMTPGLYCVRVAIFDQFRRQVFAGETLKMFLVRANETELREAPLRLISTKSEWRFRS